MRDKYLQYHRITGAFAQADRFEGILASLAARHCWLARVADAYSARFVKSSVLRKKLALLAGILECTPGFVERVDRADRGPATVVFARMGWAVAVSAAALAVSLALIGPLHLAFGLRDKR